MTTAPRITEAAQKRAAAIHTSTRLASLTSAAAEAIASGMLPEALGLLEAAASDSARLRIDLAATIRESHK